MLRALRGVREPVPGGPRRGPKAEARSMAAASSNGLGLSTGLGSNCGGSRKLCSARIPGRPPPPPQHQALPPPPLLLLRVVETPPVWAPLAEDAANNGRPKIWPSAPPLIPLTTPPPQPAPSSAPQDPALPQPPAPRGVTCPLRGVQAPMLALLLRCKCTSKRPRRPETQPGPRTAPPPQPLPPPPPPPAPSPPKGIGSSGEHGEEDHAEDTSPPPPMPLIPGVSHLGERPPSLRCASSCLLAVSSNSRALNSCSLAVSCVSGPESGDASQRSMAR